MKKILIKTIITLFASIGFSENMGTQNLKLLELLNQKDNWIPLETTVDSIEISTRELGTSGLNAIKVEKTFNMDPKFFADVIMDVKNYNLFLSNAKNLKSVAIKVTKKDVVGYQHIKIEIPFFDDREYYFYMSRDPSDIQVENVLCYWILLDQASNSYSKGKANIGTYLKNGAGLWMWESQDNGRIKIVYVLTMHPGGSIPKFFIDIINRKSIVGLFRDVEKEVIKRNKTQG